MKRTYNTADGCTVIENLDTRESSDYYPKTDEIQLDPCTPPGDSDRNLVGSLVDSYRFKPNGLLKKTLSVKVGLGHTIHIVSYYKPQDCLNGTLQAPENMYFLRDMVPHPQIQLSSTFRNGEQSEQRPYPRNVHGNQFSPRHDGSTPDRLSDENTDDMSSSIDSVS